MGVALVPLREARDGLLPRTFVDRVPAAAICGGTFATIIAITCLLSSLSLVPLCSVAVVAVSLVALASIPTRSYEAYAIDPREIADPELRSTYRLLVAAHEDLAYALEATPTPVASAAELLDRSRDMVSLFGRITRGVNPVHHVLANQDAAAIETGAAALRARAATSADAETARALTSAAEARARQLASIRTLCAMRDRIAARLELALSALQAVTAGVVALQAGDATAAALAGTSLDTHAAELSDELAALEAVHDACAA